MIVDEAYMDFYNQSVSDLISKYDNLVITKTCSKALGLAGIRVGFRGPVHACRRAEYSAAVHRQGQAQPVVKRCGDSPIIQGHPYHHSSHVIFHKINMREDFVTAPKAIPADNRRRSI